MYICIYITQGVTRGCARAQRVIRRTERAAVHWRTDDPRAGRSAAGAEDGRPGNQRAEEGGSAHARDIWSARGVAPLAAGSHLEGAEVQMPLCVCVRARLLCAWKSAGVEYIVAQVRFGMRMMGIPIVFGGWYRAKGDWGEKSEMSVWMGDEVFSGLGMDGIEMCV